MDEELEELFHNETLEDSFSHGYYQTLDFYVILVCCTVAFIADAILITAIAINKRMQNRTNLIFLCYLISNLLVQVATPSLFSPVFDFINFSMLSCITENSDVIFQQFEILSLILLTSDWVMQTNRFTDKAILSTYLGVLASFLIVLVTICMVGFFMHVLFIAFAITSILLIVLMFCKDVYTCFKGKTNPPSEEKRFRLNLVRIYIYTILLVAVVIIPNPIGPFGIVLYALTKLISVFMFVYVFKSDQRFRICILNLFRKKEDRYNVDATIGFNEDSVRAEEGKVGVDTTINQTTVNNS